MFINNFANGRKPDMCIVGGGGHVGLPLAILFASRGLHVLIYDLNEKTLQTISQGTMPFMDEGAQPMLKEVLLEGRLSFTSNVADLTGIKTIVITIGTPVDEYLNPILKVMKKCMDDLLPYLSDGQLIILRSTVYPGTTDWLHKYAEKHQKLIKLAFCPERVVQGYAIEEVQQFPQIISGTTPEAEKQAAELFSLVAPDVVHLTPMEAEFAKLFTNAYRYIQFAIANQFYMIASSAGQDYNHILQGMKKNYPRARDIPGAGFAAGPCLLKDTMQLSAFSENRFNLGPAAMVVNEGLVLYVVNQMSKKYDLENRTVGILGMAFKANNDDNRTSLSYKMKKALIFNAKEVLTTDPYVKNDPDLLPLAEVIERSDVLVLCTPHRDYKNLDVHDKPLIDIWSFTTENALVANAPSLLTELAI